MASGKVEGDRGASAAPKYSRRFESVRALDRDRVCALLGDLDLGRAAMKRTSRVAPPVVRQDGIGVRKDFPDGRVDAAIAATACNHQQRRAATLALEVELGAARLGETRFQESQRRITTSLS
jgi:hypothetical protein